MRQQLQPNQHPISSGSKPSRGIGRRTFLRGVGVTMALPLLESIPTAWAAEPSAVAAVAGATVAGGFPKRFGVFFMGNGISPPSWFAKGNGAEMELGKTLQVLEPFKQKLNVIHGLFNKSARGQGIHPAQTGQLLTGTPITKGAIIHSGISMDQVLANQLGQDTPQASMVLACEQPLTGYHESNFSNAYSSHISWQNADSPVPNEMYPSLAFDSLFENRGALRHLSVLDRVNERAKTLSQKVSSSDKGKLDEYLTSVREVEKSIERLRGDKQKADARAAEKGVPAITMKRPENGLPADWRDHTKLMVELIALAFQTDKTRIASLLLARDLSGLTYPYLGVRTSHHDSSHQETSDGYESITSLHLSYFASLAEKLEKMTEGDGNVLDHSCLMFISNMWAGSKHDNSKVPVVLLGGLGGALKTGRSFDYLNAGDGNRKLCSLYLNIMDAMGVRLDHFGDADTRLEGF